MKEIQELQEPSWKTVTKLGTLGELGRGGGGGGGGEEAINEPAGRLHQLSTMVPPESLAPRPLRPIGPIPQASSLSIFFHSCISFFPTNVNP